MTFNSQIVDEMKT